MTRKKEISDEEMKAAKGGASYSVSSQKTTPRGEFPSGVEGSDPGGVGNTDPVYGEGLTDKNLRSVKGGASTVPGSGTQPARDPRDGSPDEPDGSGRRPLGGEVK